MKLIPINKRKPFPRSKNSRVYGQSIRQLYWKRNEGKEWESLCVSLEKG